MHIFKEIVIFEFGKDVLLSRLQKNGIQFNEYANQLFEDPAFDSTGPPETVQLVKVSQEDLGLSKASTFQDIVAQAKNLGLKTCSLITAAYLRLAYLDQPEGPYLKVVSPKAGNSDDDPRGLYLRKVDNVLWLRGFCASDDWEYGLDTEFIFQK